jgi:putative transposase
LHWRHRRLRRPAANEPGNVHEWTFSCFRGCSFLRAEHTCQWLADAINAARAKFNISLWAYVFMPDHVHLLIYPNEPDYKVSAILKAIKQPVGTKAIKCLSGYAPHWLQRVGVRHRNGIERRF